MAKNISLFQNFQRNMTKIWLSFVLLGFILATFTAADDCNGACGNSPAADAAADACGVTCTDGGLCVNQVGDEALILKDPSSTGYIVCRCGCEIKMVCPAGLEFNITNYRCDWPAGYDSSGTSSGTSGGCSECGGTETNSVVVTCDNDVTLCKNQDDGTLFAMDGVCNQFYKCAYGCAVPQYCPANLVYDPTQLQCEYPWTYTCPWPYTAPSGPGVGPSGIDCPAGGRCVGQENGVMFTSTISSGQYVVCECECEVEMDCPAGLVYNASLETCDYPSAAADVACA